MGLGIVETTYENACKLLNAGHREAAIGKLLTLAYGKDDMKAQWKLGELYAKSNPREAEKWYLKSAEQGYAKAMLGLGLLYENHEMYDKAVSYYIKGVNAGNGFCRKCLFRMCVAGKCSESTCKSLYQLYEKKAEAGYVEAMRNMGDMYSYGIGVEKNQDIAIKWYRKGADKGDEACLERLLLDMYENPDERDLKYKLDLEDELVRNGLNGTYAGIGYYGDLHYIEYRDSGYTDKDSLKAAIHFYEIATSKGSVESKKKLKLLREQGLYRKRNINTIGKRDYRVQIKKYEELLPNRYVTDVGDYKETAKKYMRHFLGLGQGMRLLGIGDVKILSVRSYPGVTATKELLYEERSICNFIEATHEYPDENTFRKSKPVDVWEFPFITPPGRFKEDSTKFPVKDEKGVICRCFDCEGQRMIPCKCGGKKTLCGKCSGTGQQNCLYCHGTGQSKCYECGGTGKIEESYQMKMNGDWVTSYRKVTCPSCNGLRGQLCTYCDGSGKETCTSCGGGGYAICPICYGRSIVECERCEGSGRIKIKKGVEITEHLETLAFILKDYDIDPNIYGDNKMETMSCDSYGDSLLVTYTSSEPIDYIPIADYEPGNAGWLGNYYDMKCLTKLYKEKSGEMEHHRVHKYRISIYQREMLEVKFKYKGRENYCHIDVRAGKCIFDKNFKE